MKVKVVSRILQANDRLADENRRLFKEKGVYVINLMSAPGAGKTTLIVETIKALKDRVSIGVVEGDIVGTDDAERIDSLGIPVVQINTHGACHLDANMVREVLDELPLQDIRLLIVENVGNLVCPAEFNIGEDMKVMLLSVSEGDDKPGKYPLMFQESSALLINKIDLLPYLDIDIERIKSTARALNPEIEIIELSCKTGQGMDRWVTFLEEKLQI